MNQFINSCKRYLNRWVILAIIVAVVGLIIFIPILGIISLFAALPLIGCAAMCGAMAFLMKGNKHK